MRNPSWNREKKHTILKKKSATYRAFTDGGFPMSSIFLQWNEVEKKKRHRAVQWFLKVFGTIIANSICDECGCSANELFKWNWPQSSDTFIDRDARAFVCVYTSCERYIRLEPVELISFTRLNWRQRSISLDWCQNDDESCLYAVYRTRDVLAYFFGYHHSIANSVHRFFDERNREIIVICYLRLI